MYLLRGSFDINVNKLIYTTFISTWFYIYNINKGDTNYKDICELDNIFINIYDSINIVIYIVYTKPLNEILFAE